MRREHLYLQDILEACDMIQTFLEGLLADDVLCAKGLAVLEDQLGPVQALRFLALISRQPFDYQSWRQQHFEGMSLDEILTKVQVLPQDQGRHS